MNKSKNKKRRFAIVLIVLFIGLSVFFIIKNYSTSSGPTDQDIRTKFACDRVTQEVRETDIFCNPEFYRNPDLSEDRYSEYMNCKNHTKKPSPDEAAYNEAYAKAYDICVDKIKFNVERLKFNEQLKELKTTH